MNLSLFVGELPNMMLIDLEDALARLLHLHVGEKKKKKKKKEKKERKEEGEEKEERRKKKSEKWRENFYFIASQENILVSRRNIARIDDKQYGFCRFLLLALNVTRQNRSDRPRAKREYKREGLLLG